MSKPLKISNGVKIGGLQKLTLIDYPGKLACTVFLAGCNYQCAYCYNPELVLLKKIKEQPTISEKEFFRFLKERKRVLEAVCVAGGEPTIHQDLPGFCQKIKKMGYKVKLDTNGSNPKMLKDLIVQKLVDYVAMDVKAPRGKYAKVIGFKGLATNYLLHNIKKSIELLKQGKVDYEFRSTVSPLLKKKDILKIARWLKPAKKYCLQNFQPGNTIDPRLKNRKPFPQEVLFEIQKAIAPFFDVCQVR